ncbi:ATP-grasp domain-containing protein [Acanthopleuribacter pedis]|uniref:ATP-grasp domain-containing protein n=1 Tax=Acanthopleuribacter pedis TaxID=442870 RepID=A0A8J7U5T4_9BACT|nr:ATP-grasp domain-containing protein [Acanthopleuribacter pedis]MBO1322893.1 ATP-grasp domain-containing protein [Acanthopleuribacter pedis]
MSITWVLETEVYPDQHQTLIQSVQTANQQVISWRESWTDPAERPRFDGQTVLFHGSLAVADQLHREGTWQPGAFCDTARFHCSHWFPRFPALLIQEQVTFSTVRRLCEHPAAVLAELGNPSKVFVRPDSPLKPFSGRVLTPEQLTPRGLDHGFYYDDLDLPVVVCAPITISAEWRFVACAGTIVAASAYQAEGRQALGDAVPGEAAAAAQAVAAHPEWQDALFVVDIGRSEQGYRLVELNPFSGADLYHCDRDAIVRAVTQWVKPSSL